MSTHPTMEQHPDLAEMRSRFERATSSPRGQAVEALAFLTGVYLAASPWIAGFSGITALATTNLILGIAYVLCMGPLGSAFERTHAMAWCAVCIGAFTIISPWIVTGNVDTTRTVWNNVIVGAVALVLGAAMAATGERGAGAALRARRGGGAAT
ncbi:SPW repeat protein [Streptomyces apocyni]|uniref:SPW repeat protein n=1 Tax=Streptomyces apocyni TaxID=2654677 RepID=UPI0012EA2017|nr:SPW repeat protein [Streptomyces apocyni]